MNLILIETRAAYPDWKGCGCAKASADDPVQLFPTEAPRYDSLGAAVGRSWRATTRAFSALRTRWFEVIAQDDPAKVSPEQAQRLLRAQRAGGLGWVSRKEPLDRQQKEALDQAAEEFLRTFAGGDRSAEAFADSDTEDGILQQTEFLAHHVGVERAQRLLKDDATQNPAFTEAQRRRLLEDAFSRLSADGKLRFEARLGEIRDALIAGFNAGDNPLAIARTLGANLDGYEQGRLRTIVRTETAIASEGAIRDTYQANGISRGEVIGDPSTDEACTIHIGQVYDLEDDDNLPIYHPNCFCSVVPHVERED